VVPFLLPIVAAQMRVLVYGGTGFAGRHPVTGLTEMDALVRALVGEIREMKSPSVV